MKSRVPWWASVFLAAAAFRLFALWGADRAIGQRHIYLTSALWITEHQDPLHFVWQSTEWQNWPGGWTLAPLYTLTLSALFFVLGPNVGLAQLLQGLMDSLTAVWVGALGRELSPARGHWAGWLYALYWPAAFMASRPLTENLHTFLLVPAFVLLVRGATRGEPRVGAAAGFLLGLSALARAVSSAFLPLAALWTLLAACRRRAVSAVLVLACGFAAILPWTARNVLALHDAVLIESVSAFNLWNDNAFVDEPSFDAQKRAIAAQPTPAARRARATAFALSAIVGNPDRLLRKAWDNFWHVLRPDGLRQLLIAEDPDPGWWHALSILFGDLPLLLCLPLFLVFLARRPPPAGNLVALWTLYYLFLVVVLFHSEIRYRSPLVPFLFVGATASWDGLRQGPLRRLDLLAAAFGVFLLLVALSPYALPGARALRTSMSLPELRRAADRGDAVLALDSVRRISAADPGSARPWLVCGRWLAARGYPAQALTAYEEAARRRPEHPVPALVRPRLLQDAGYPSRALRALEQADAVAERLVPGEALEIAWRELPPPRQDEIQLGRNDYGAVLGFVQAGPGYRISRPRAWLRLRPTESAPAYRLTLVMASPPESPLQQPVVEVRVNRGAAASFTLSPEARPFTLSVPGAEELLVEIRAPAWSRSDQPPDQGVRVERLSVEPTT
jgi:tetratricopeptide (TPR) repeat protein